MLSLQLNSRRFNPAYGTAHYSLLFFFFIIMKEVPSAYILSFRHKLNLQIIAVQVRQVFPRCQIVGRRFPICHVYVDDIIIEVCSTFHSFYMHFSYLPISQVRYNLREVSWLKAAAHSFLLSFSYCSIMKNSQSERTLFRISVSPSFSLVHSIVSLGSMEFFIFNRCQVLVLQQGLVKRLIKI